jgi:hypothetical protein
MLGLVRLALLGLTIQWFLAEFGLAGGVMAVVLATAVSKALALQRIRSVMRCSLAEFLPWQNLALTLLIAAAAAFPAWLLKSMLVAPPLLRLLLAGAVYTATYAGLLWRYGPLSTQEKSVLIEWACRPVTGMLRGYRALVAEK